MHMTLTPEKKGMALATLTTCCWLDYRITVTVHSFLIAPLLKQGICIVFQFSTSHATGSSVVVPLFWSILPLNVSQIYVWCLKC